MPYLIQYRGYFTEPVIRVFETEEHTRWALDLAKGQDTTGIVISSGRDLRELGTKKSLTDLYKALASEADDTLSTFSSKADGQQKLFALIEERAKGIPPETAPSQPEPQQPEAPPSSTNEQETDVVTKASKRKKAAKKAKGKAPRITAKAASNGAARNGSITETITKMVSRERGATKKEIVAAIMEKAPDRNEVSTDNTVRGILSVMGRREKPKLKKDKIEKRDGLVYTL